MTNHDTLTVTPPSLPKGGGAIQSIGKGLGPVGTDGSATVGIGLPISTGRGWAPALSLSYSSHAGNGLCGMGWGLSQNAVSRYIRLGVPAYDDDDLFEGPDGEVWMPVRDEQGRIERKSVRRFRDLDRGATWQVARYQRRVKHSFDLLEHWRSDTDQTGFWMIQGADASLQVYGFTDEARITAPDGKRVAQWLLQESMNAHGEHIVYHYKAEDGHGVDPDSPRESSAQRYLSRVCYGNAQASADLYAWDTSAAEPLWHFQLLFDYGERHIGMTAEPTYQETHPWALRSDPYSSYAYGFELRTWRLCRQVLMFHHFPAETGDDPVLVQRLLLDYQTTDLGYSQLLAAHPQAYDARRTLTHQPPSEFGYSGFNPEQRRYDAFPVSAGLNDGGRYQLVDLYGEGMPGLLYRDDQCWYYREPYRDADASDADAIRYGDWQALPRIPATDLREPVGQSLTDVTGNGRLDWIVSQQGLQGFFTLGPDRHWSNFTPFAAFPREFLHAKGQMADLIGDGLSDLTLIGSQSVRLYRSTPGQPGFDDAADVDHDYDDDDLPTLHNSQTEIVAFSDVLGSGQQHLIRIRHDEIRCWPNLGHGTFGRSFRFCDLPFDYATFDPSRVLLADLDGSGATDLIYMTPEHFAVFMNQGGNGLAHVPLIHPWPDDMRHDRFCQVTAADVQGLGCSSLIVTHPHGAPRHWRCNFITQKPYLLISTNNNMGASGRVTYRSSAQEWLDEKQERLAAGKTVACHVPFAMHLVSRQQQLDEITGNQLTQSFRYREGYYDGKGREMRGYGLLLQTDSEALSGVVTEHDSAPLLTKTWFYTGSPDDLSDTGHDTSDPKAKTVGPALLLDGDHRVIAVDDGPVQQDMARTLSGSTLRVETFGLDGGPLQALPYSVQQQRYGVVLEQAPGNGNRYSIMRPLLLESVTSLYERQPDDPRCEHQLNLEWDRFDSLTHSVAVSYARRKTPQDEPPFEAEHKRTWWRDTHDPSQGDYHLAETRAEFIHLEDPQYLRLGLPYRGRHDALVLHSDELKPQSLTFEVLRDRENPLNPLVRSASRRVLTGLSMQCYKRPLPFDDRLDPGQSTYQALPGDLESAELDENALQVYDDVLSRPELEKRLEADGYRKMSTFLPADDTVLWATRTGFVTYGADAAFNRPVSVRSVERQGETLIGDDNYHCLLTSITNADGCKTECRYDYGLMVPTHIVDPNANVQEALYDGFGGLQASTFFGTQRGKPAGFAPIACYVHAQLSPREAINRPEVALQGAAAAHFHDAFAWMGQAPQARIDDPQWLARQVEAGNLLPSGHIRHSARQRLTSDPASAQWVSEAVREPVYAVSLTADRYPDDPEPAQIRISSVSWDGFGRTLQTRQKVEPGTAWQIRENGTLATRDTSAVTVHSPVRWRISERVEYNHKGLVVRVYRPYFADQCRYIDDASLRLCGFSDEQRYDPTGRPTLTITAKGLWRRTHYLPWYTINEDENDTFEDAMAMISHESGKELNAQIVDINTQTRTELLDPIIKRGI